LTFSASCLLIFEEAWNRINGFFFNDNKTEIIPWVDRVSWSGSQDRPNLKKKSRIKKNNKIKNKYVLNKSFNYWLHCPQDGILSEKRWGDIAK